ncbi:MAG: DUF3540 domain-containing protein [bacterium]
MLLETREYLGPADVIRAEGGSVWLALAGREVRARLAFSFFYEPVPGDVLLAIGGGDDFYAIGVLKGNGKVKIESPSDLQLRAGNGVIDIISTQQIRLRARGVQIQATRFELLARTVRERLGAVRRWVRGSVDVTARDVRHSVSGDYNIKAERVTTRASGEVFIDGNKINLG